MVRVHVRPPSFRLPDPCVRRVSLASPGKGGCRPAIWRGIRRPPAKRETQFSFRAPRVLARGAIDQVVFSSRSEAPPSPGGERRGSTTGRPGAEFWRPGCTGARRMPWRRQAMKDAASCEKPRGGACGPGSGDVRMGQPALREEGAGA